jgi:hypothetical protein
MVAPAVYAVGVGLLRLGVWGYRAYKASKVVRQAPTVVKQLKKVKDGAAKVAKPKKKCTGNCGKPKRNPCAHLAKGNKAGKGPFRGGSYDGTKGVGAKGMESNHIPPKSVSPLSPGKSPAIQMDYPDHRIARSTGSGKRAEQWRAQQQDLIRQGRYRDAAAMDYKDARRVARQAGDPKKYNEALKERSAYQKCLEKFGLLPGKK